MPIYEYRCSECGHQDEHLQKVSEAPLAQCPACGKNTYKKLLSAAGFHLKGSGWYATDFKGGGAAKKDKAEDGKAGAKPESKPDSKSDSKPDSKPENKPKSETAA
jgi:putative FmdB family regulatory protein